MAYTSGYLVVFGAIMVAVVVVARVPDWWRRARRVVPLFAVATVLASAGHPARLSSVSSSRGTMGMRRPLEAVSEFSATVTGYLATAGRIHFSTWSSRFLGNPVDLFFPGVVVLVLARSRSLGVRADDRGRRWQRSTAAPRFVDRQRADPAADRHADRDAATASCCRSGCERPCTGGCITRFRRCRACERRRGSATFSCLAMAALAGSGLRPLRGRLPRPARRARRRRPRRARNLESLRAPVGYTRFEGIPADLLGARAGAGPRRARRSAVLAAAGRVRARASTCSIPPRTGVQC